MKKILFAGFAGAILLTSCSTVQSAKVAQSQRVDYLKLKGDWRVTNVDYPNNFKVSTLGEDADAKCWVGSVWHLVPNNYTGSYAITGSGQCPNVTQPFRFEVRNGSEFVFKKIPTGVKAKEVTQGYSLNLVGQTADTFQLQQNAVSTDGAPVTITYTFNKVTK